MRLRPTAPGFARFHRILAGIGLLPLLALCLFLLLPGCSGSESSSGGKGKAKKSGPAPVTVAVSTSKDMPVSLEAIGTVEPFASVAINSQVAGILEKVHFQEGDPVKNGDILFSIDPRPFAARLAQAQAALARDQAALDHARKQAARYLPAAREGYVSEEQADQARSSVSTLEASVQAGKASVENARLDLAECTIRSPISGFAGALLADQGNLVRVAADQPLVTINQITPVKVNFTLPEQNVPELKKHLSGGSLEVRAALPEQSDRPLPGKLTFLDNTVNPATGTIRLKATFANPDRVFWPGRFVDVRVLLGVRKGATVVPAQAVQTGQNGAFVFVVTKEQTVEPRPVTVGFSAGAESVIDAGLAVGETVVVDGQLRLKPGAKIKPVDAGAKPDKAGESS